MGFFSADCNGCNHPLLSEYATNPINQWMEQGVTIYENGSLIKGRYDGYGRYAMPSANEPIEGALEGTVWHEACWNAAGSPTDYRGVSPDSPDQGYFFDDGDHDMPEPTVPTAPAQPPSAPAEHPQRVVTAGPTDSGPQDRRFTLAEALTLFIVTDEATGEPVCQTNTTGIGGCFRDGKTADAKYSADRACGSCIAHHTLNDIPCPTGPGAHADE